MTAVEKRGRRYYIVGDTYGIREELRDAGCHWDPAERAWWTGKQEIAERFAQGSSGESSERSDPTVRDDQPLLGKVRYQAKSGKEGTWFVAAKARSGRLLLTNLAADRVFWADPARCTWLKTYAHPDDRRYGRGTTLASIRDFLARKKAVERRGETVEEMRDREVAERAEWRGVCREPGCGNRPAPGKMGYCDQCYFDEFDC